MAGALLEPAIGSAQLVELRPDLQAFPAFDLAVVPDGGGGHRLIFAALTWNGGDGPLELVARETGGSPGSEVQNVYQRVFYDDGSYTEHLAGTFEYHPLHAHFHFENYALYTLQLAAAPGQSQRTGSKTTFCVIDTNRIDHKLPGAPKRSVYRWCNDDVQGMSVGWGDEYGSHLAGQEIDVTGLAADDYTLTIEVDPKAKLDETNESDNTSCVLLHIDVASQSVDILNASGCSAPGGGEVVVSTVEPAAVARGSVTPVTVTGSGFEAGMALSFENGSGPRPTASDVVIDANTDTITAYVTAKDGGPPGPRTWDVRVGSGLLPAGLTVF
jgi:hypothetical protein